MRASRPGRVFEAGPDHLVCDGRVVAPLTVAETARTRRRGLLGTSSVQGALWITRCPSVHMMGMRYPIDVAVLDRTGRVLHRATLSAPFGLTRPRLRAGSTVEAAAGSMEGWGIEVGSRLAIERAESVEE